MNLNDFEGYIEDIILRRGHDYYTAGQVVRLEELKDHRIRARVKGTDIYTVEVLLDEDGEVMGSSCDCSYDRGEFCKHQAAVFYALQAGSNKIKVADPLNQVLKTSKLDTILAKLERDKLAEMICSICSEYREIEKQLLLQYAGKEEEISASKKLIREYINKAQQRGFINRVRAELAMTGAYWTLAKADQRLDEKDYYRAVELCQVVLSIVVQVLQYCDDSDGIVGDVINESLSIIDDAATSANRHTKLPEQKRLFSLVLKEARHKRYDGWDDWRFELFQVCAYFSSIPELRSKIEQELDSQLEKLNNQEWSGEYKRAEIKLIQLSIIESCDGAEAADRFINDNIDLRDFREKAIQKAYLQGNYEYMLQLCIEGEETDQEYAGLIHKWREYRFAAYEKQGDVTKQCQLAYGFIMKGEFTYYTKLKNLYPAEQWQIILENILNEFEKSTYQREVYIQILIEENLTERILHYCQRNPQSVIQLHKYLVKDYMGELNDLFVTLIRTTAKEVSNRSGYKKVCGVIKLYQKVCGDISAHRIISEMKQSYPRRPAFLDELAKIK